MKEDTKKDFAVHRGILFVLPSGRRFDLKLDDGPYLIGDGAIHAPHLSYQDLCRLAGQHCEIRIDGDGNLLHAEIIK